ncbi:hypothetical protein DRO31_04445, partial [Candidatus Bathyarchaeota archaeon]
MSIREILDGLVFSDGFVAEYRKKTGIEYRLEVGTTNEQYVRELRELLKNHLSVRIRKQRRRGFGMEFMSWRLHASNVEILRPLRQRWYNEEGKKRLPDDFRWTPTVLNVAFCGDGTIIQGSPALCVNSWRSHEVNRIVSEFERIGVYGTIMDTATGPVFRVYSESARDFYRYIGEPLLKCFRYKWIDIANPQEAVQASQWTAETAAEVAKNVKKMYMLKTTNGPYSAYVPTLVIQLSNETVKKALERVSPRRKRKFKPDEAVAYGRQAKRILERIFEFLSEEQKQLAAVLLALPIGRRKRDLKEKLYQRFWELANGPHLQRLSAEGPHNVGMRQSGPR